MKKLLAIVTALAISLLVGDSALAAPFKAHDKNPNVVAYYPTGPHGIPDEPGIFHEGEDLVMRAGNSGNFQQWFYGFADEDGGIIEGDHTVWRLQKHDKVPSSWTLIPDAHPEWGDYLVPGADYLVKTNDFKSPGHHTP